MRGSEPHEVGSVGLYVLLQNRERMNNTFPFSFLESFAARFQPPPWVVDEAQQRLVLAINHVVGQEPEAQSRLVRQKGRVVHLRFGVFEMDLLVTPAGLVDRSSPLAKSDLLIIIPTDSPLALVKSVMTGQTPPVKIEGDVQLAAEVAWLADNLRWDSEEDLSRLIGDAPAHALAEGGRRLVSGLKSFLSRPTRADPGAATAVVRPKSESDSATATRPDGARADR